MCHQTPTSQLLALLVCVFGLTYNTYHIWRYDRFRCLRFTKRDAFRWLILQLLNLSTVLLLTWNLIMVWVKYSEWYTVIETSPTTMEILPLPHQLWSAQKASITRAAYQILAITWGILLTIHAEESLYWAYLIQAIRRRAPGTWFQSLQFKAWLVVSAFVLCLMIGGAQIETTDLLEMEANIFMIGSCFAAALFLSSIWLLLVFPRFIADSRRQGANPQVVGRLEYFRELNVVRTAFRMAYAVSFLMLAIDARTDSAYLNNSAFWLECLYMTGIFSITASSTISTLIFLPITRTPDASATGRGAVFVRPAPHGKPHRFSDKVGPHGHGGRGLSDTDSDADTPQKAGWDLLGDRLRIDKDDVEDLVASQAGGNNAAYDLPFAATPGTQVVRNSGDLLDFHQASNAINQFRSPLDVSRPNEPVNLNIVVVTNTVVEDD
ncbi:hypothetical protein Q5752_006265 [Cryptotrichosporon argae]